MIAPRRPDLLDGRTDPLGTTANCGLRGAGIVAAAGRTGIARWFRPILIGRIGRSIRRASLTQVVAATTVTGPPGGRLAAGPAGKRTGGGG
jgi:hypothetical protein